MVSSKPHLAIRYDENVSAAIMNSLSAPKYNEVARFTFFWIIWKLTDELKETTGTWNWIFYTYFALLYFAEAVLVWTIYFLRVMHYIRTLFCIWLCCYLNSTVALCKFPCIWWEFEEFTHWLGGCIVDVWSLHALVVYVSRMSCQVKVKSSFWDMQKSVLSDIVIGFPRIIIVPLFSISMIMKL